MKFHYALLALALACNGDDGDKTGETATSGDTGPTDTDDTDTDACAGGAYDGPINITGAMVTCAADTATFTANVDGLTGGGWVYMQETGNTPPNWSANHSLESTAPDADCNRDVISRSIATGGEEVVDVSTVFTCADHLEDNDVMTFAFGASDATGNVVDCYAFGEAAADPAGAVADNAGADPDFDLTNCEAGTEAM